LRGLAGWFSGSGLFSTCLSTVAVIDSPDMVYLRLLLKPDGEARSLKN
jgi:hypothetical protein